MFKAFIRQRLAAFESQWNYPMAYSRELLGMGLAGFSRFNRATAMAHHRSGIALTPWHLARLGAVLHEDCGACVQLVTDMARASGVEARTLRAALAQDDAGLQALDADAALAWCFVRACLADTPDLPQRRQAAHDRFGEEGFQSLVLAMLGMRLYPQIKRALGHHQTCQRVRIDGIETIPANHVPRRLV